MNGQAFQSTDRGWNRSRSLVQYRRGERIRITYENGQGVRTEREIRVLRTYRSRYGVRYLEAYCHLKQERRTFRLDRILSVAPSDNTDRPTHPVVLHQDRPRNEQLHPTVAPAMSRPRGRAGRQSEAANERAQRRSERSLGVLVAFGVVVAITAATLSQKARSAEETTAAFATPVGVATKLAFTQVNTSKTPLPAVAARPNDLGAHEAIHRYPYRGYAVEEDRVTSGSLYTVASLGIAAPTLRSAYLAVNARLFERRTRIRDPRLEAIYAAADSDRNGHLSWQEIVSFQKTIYAIFSYKPNTTALRPDEFLDQRGGDCEDWALFTAGLLQYWGWNVEIATFLPTEGTTGHAVAFVRVQSPIPGIGTYTIYPSQAAPSLGIEAGTYIPIDYNDVGEFTNAMHADYYLYRLSAPEALYGQVM